MICTQDSNGNILRRDIRREGDGWGVTVWFGDLNGLGTNVQRRIYPTRSEARDADISTWGRVLEHYTP